MPLLQAVLIGLVALILAPGALFYFDVTPKLVVLLVGVAFFFACASLRPAHRIFSLLLLATVVSLILSTALSPAPALSLYGSTWRRYGLVAQVAVLIFAWFVSQTPDRRTVVRGISVAGAISARLRHRAVLRLGSDPAGCRVPHRRRRAGRSCARPARSAMSATSRRGCWYAGFLSLSLETRGALYRGGRNLLDARCS